MAISHSSPASKVEALDPQPSLPPTQDLFGLHNQTIVSYGAKTNVKHSTSNIDLIVGGSVLANLLVEKDLHITCSVIVDKG